MKVQFLKVSTLGAWVGVTCIALGSHAASAGEAQFDQNILTTAMAYFKAIAERDIPALQAIMAFPPEVDDEEFFRKFALRSSAGHVDISQELFCVPPCKRIEPDGFMFLVPTSRGYLPQFLDIRIRDGKPVVWYNPNHWRFTGEWCYATWLVEEEAKWRGMTQAELQIALEERLSVIEANVRALEYALANGIDVRAIPGMTIESGESALDRLRGVTPEQFRAIMLEEMARVSTAYHGPGREGNDDVPGVRSQPDYVAPLSSAEPKREPVRKWSSNRGLAGVLIGLVLAGVVVIMLIRRRSGG